MITRIAFTLYGIVVAAADTAILLEFLPQLRFADVALGLVMATCLGVLGWKVSADTTHSIGAKLFLILLAPWGLLSALALLIPLALFVILILWPICAVGWFVHEQLLRIKLKSQGRFITQRSLQPRLEAGEGTLIEEHNHKGPFRIWWTAEDIWTKGTPPATDADYFSIMGGAVHAFNSDCLKEYLDLKTGKGILTSIPARRARSGKLSQAFPSVGVAKLIHVPHPRPSDSSPPQP